MRNLSHIGFNCAKISSISTTIHALLNLYLNTASSFGRLPVDHPGYGLIMLCSKGNASSATITCGIFPSCGQFSNLIVHPDFQWRCRYCPKKYGSRAARNKHEIVHIHGYRFFCSYEKCTKKFVFTRELEEHARKHTRKILWPCTFKDCDKAYPCKCTRDSHVCSHTAEDWTCTVVLDDGSTHGQECVFKNH